MKLFLQNEPVQHRDRLIDQAYFDLQSTLRESAKDMRKQRGSQERWRADA